MIKASASAIGVYFQIVYPESKDVSPCFPRVKAATYYSPFLFDDSGFVPANTGIVYVENKYSIGSPMRALLLVALWYY